MRKQIKSTRANFKYQGIQINRVYQGVIDTGIYKITCRPKRLTIDDALDDAQNEINNLMGVV